MSNITQSQQLFSEAIELLPGGVNSPVRAFGAVGGAPRFMVRGEGAYIFDVDGNRYVDMLSSWGPLILGHAHAKVVAAVEKAARNGLSFGTPCEDEIALARLIVEAFPGVERLRMVNSGTEATMTAVRLARAFTGRDKIIKVEGGYHGHADPFLVAAGSGATTFGTPNSPGVTANTVRDSIVIPYNDPKALEAAFQKNPGGIAVLIVEPVPGNMGVIPPADGYLAAVREITSRHGALLIFDEVITGFRVARGGAQKRFGVTPDLTALGKIIGGGMPVGAFGGKKEIMNLLAPSGPVYQAGTLSGNPVAMAAGRATLEETAASGFYEALEQKSNGFFTDLREMARKVLGATEVNHVGSMGTLFFNTGPITDYTTAKESNAAAYGRFFHLMLERGVYLAPAQFECMFVSAAHTDADLNLVLRAADESLRMMRD